MTLRMNPAPDYEIVLREVCRSVAFVLRDTGLNPEELEARQSLIELGIDSLNLADLAVVLEDSLGFAQFPLQEWADAEASKEPIGFTIAALTDACVALLGARSAGP